MSKVELIRNGRAVKVDSRLADHLLSRRGLGYTRRDMAAQAAPARPPQLSQVVEPSGSATAPQTAAERKAAKKAARAVSNTPAKAEEQDKTE